jgi:hypothetical protein
MELVKLLGSYQTCVKDFRGTVGLITHYNHSLILRLFDNAISTAGLIYPHGKGPSTHWIGGWVHPRTSLDDVEK